VARILDTLGTALLCQKKYNEIERILREALEILLRRQTGEQNLPDVLDSFLPQILRGQVGEPVLPKVRGFFRPPTTVKGPDPITEEVLGNLVRLYLETGRPAEAAATALERSKHWPSNPNQRYIAGRELAQCVLLVGKNKEQSTNEERSEQQGYTKQAVEMIRQAVRKGFSNVNQLNTDNGFAPVRGSSEFQRLLVELDKSRTAWAYQGGVFRKIQDHPVLAVSALGMLGSQLSQDTFLATPATVSGGSTIRGAAWEEHRNKRVSCEFKEIARNLEYIELYDSSRRSVVRLYRNRACLRPVDRNQWYFLFNGSWQD
jgi:hypothetical protein